MDTFSSDIPNVNDSNISINPTQMPDFVIDQNNHDLAVRVNENDFDANSIHENLDDTGFDDDGQVSEVEQNTYKIKELHMKMEQHMNMMNPM